MTAPLISICVPLYNRAAYLALTLEALLAQTYPNVEIVVSDNGSDDGSSDIAVEYACKHDCLRYQRLQATVSQNESWRYALRLASGDFVNLHSADDSTLPADFLEKMVAPLLTQSEIDFSVCAINTVAADGFDARAAEVMVRVHALIAKHIREVIAEPCLPMRAEKLLSLAMENRVGSPYAMLCRRAALPWTHWKKTAAYWPESYMDWDFMLRLLLHKRGVWVADTHCNYHLDEQGGYWKVISGQNARTALFDKVYRFMMPLTVLLDPELAPLRTVASGQQMQELHYLAGQRLAEAETAVERDRIAS